MKDGLLKQRVDIHDRTQLEIRLNYDQDLEKKSNCYTVEAFLFFPKSLRIDKHHYSKKAFYQDLKTNIRIRTPRIAISKLVDSDNDASLKSRISAPFDRLLSGQETSSDIDDITYELKLFAAIFRGQVRDQINHFIQLVDHVQDDPHAFPTLCQDLQKLLKLFLKEVSHAIGVFRKLRTKFRQPNIPTKLKLIFEEINEFISLIIDTQLSRLALRISEVAGLRELIDPSHIKLTDLLAKEAQYRKGADYLSGNPHHHDGEKYIYRMGELKKTIMEVLFLRPKLKKEGVRASQFIAMVAAGIAMAWALGALVLGNVALAANSVPFLLLMILSYIIKDRIKDWVRTILNQKILSRFFHDRKMELYLHKTKKPVGYVRETFQFVDKRDVPLDVLRTRYPVNSGRRFESIIKHTRIITLNTWRFKKLYSRIANVTRLSINNFLSKMDDSTVLMPCYIEDEGIGRVTMSKVYHIHLILRLSTCRKEAPIIEHFRVIADKNGIKRLEELTLNSKIENTILYPSHPTEIMIEPGEASQPDMPLPHTKEADVEEVQVDDL